MVHVALLIGNGQYDSAALRRLRSPSHDVRGIGTVLKEVGHFQDVRTVVDATHAELSGHVQRFLTGAGRDDLLLLLYFSGHGLKDTCTARKVIAARQAA
jgi:uncharacterized caspase-like protein